jgi:alcohol-forming fatty acyl-CoA reductase
VTHVVGSTAEQRQGRYTGRMAEPPCVDEKKAVYARRYLAKQGLDLDLAESYAYADSYSDMGLFEMVGHPVAVYPDAKLAEHAARCGWPILQRN